MSLVSGGGGGGRISPKHFKNDPRKLILPDNNVLQFKHLLTIINQHLQMLGMSTAHQNNNSTSFKVNRINMKFTPRARAEPEVG